MNVSSLVFNFTAFAFVTMHCQNVRVVFNFAETVHTEIHEINPTRNLRLLQ